MSSRTLCSRSFFKFAATNTQFVGKGSSHPEGDWELGARLSVRLCLRATWDLGRQRSYLTFSKRAISDVGSGVET